MISLSIDPFYYSLEDILPSPYERSIKIIALSWLLRLFLLNISILECFRWASITTILLVIAGYGVTSILNKLIKLKSSVRCLSVYVRLRLLFASTENAVRIPLCLALALLHFCTIMINWLVVRCWDLIPLSLCLIAIVLSLCLTIFSCLLLPTAAKVSMDSKKLIRVRRDRHRHRTMVQFHKWWQAQMSIDIPCGIFFHFGPMVTTKYLNWLINNLGNAVLLLEPDDQLQTN